LRHAAVREQHLAGGAGAHTHLVFFFADAKARRPFLDDERRDAVLRSAAIRYRHRDADVSILRICGEGLPAIDHPALALAYRLRARAGGIRARLRLRQRPAADPLARGELRNIALSLVVITGEINVVGAQRRVRGDDQSDRWINSRQLLDDQRVLDVAESRAAKLLRKNG